MSITVDPDDPRLKRTAPDGQQEAYLVLSEDERAKGFVRPYRDTYVHCGERPKYPTRPLEPDEVERYKGFGYVCFEGYPPEARSVVVGRFWTQKQLSSGCNQTTTMGRELSETYARDPKFYGATFCAACCRHFPVSEFVWTDGSVVGS